MAQNYKKYKPKAKKPKEEKIAEERAVAKNIQWFPGHMAKAKREIIENLKSVDIAIELCDARIPSSSRNPMIKEILGTKPSILLMNKASLADSEVSKKWREHYKQKGVTVLFTDCITGEGVGEIIPRIREVLTEKLERFESKGMTGRLPRAMIIGITNAGKSTLINTLCKSSKLKTEDRPGVTKMQQWVTLKGGVELLDTPGILWPKFQDEKTALKLAFIGSIRDEITDKEEIAVQLCALLARLYPDLLKARYKITEDIDNMQPHEIFELIGRKRGFFISGGEVDYLRTAVMLTDEFRGGKIGRISLEVPPENIKEQT